MAAVSAGLAAAALAGLLVVRPMIPQGSDTFGAACIASVVGACRVGAAVGPFVQRWAVPRDAGAVGPHSLLDVAAQVVLAGMFAVAAGGESEQWMLIAVLYLVVSVGLSLVAAPRGPAGSSR
jgi:hypothetical protein